MSKIIEIEELGFPKSLIIREGALVSELIDTKDLVNELNSALHKTSVSHSMSGDGMNSLEFFDMRKKEESVPDTSLLDDFAKAAMQGMVASVFSPNGLQGGDKEGLATYAYDIATVMMQERERRMKG